MGSDLQAEPLQRKRKPWFGATSEEGPRKRPRITPSAISCIKAAFTEYDYPESESEDEVISIRSDVSFSVPIADIKVEPDFSSEASTSPVVAYRSFEGIENFNDLVTSTPRPGQTSPQRLGKEVSLLDIEPIGPANLIRGSFLNVLKLDALDPSQVRAPSRNLPKIYNKLQFEGLRQKLKSVKHSTGEESRSRRATGEEYGTIQTTVIENDNSPPLVKRELFTCSDLESSSSQNDSSHWVHPLSTAEDVSEQAENAPLVPCIPVPATAPIPALYEDLYRGGRLHCTYIILYYFQFLSMKASGLK